MKHKITAIAVDDELHSLKTLSYELERICPEVELIHMIQNPDDAFKIIQETEFDLLFLDIHLQTTNGIDLLERLMPVDFDVIFVTAYDEYAIKAFDLSAMHYLLKPINKNKLRIAIEKVKQKKYKNSEIQYVDMVEALRNEISGSHKVAIPVHDGIEFINPETIIYVKADSNYSTLYFSNGKKLTVSKTLKTVEQSYLTSGFIRIHKSHIINIKELNKYVKNDGGYVVMSDGTKLEVSRSKRQVLNDLY